MDWLNQQYAYGANAAYEELCKVAGEEFAQKVASKMGWMKDKAQAAGKAIGNYHKGAVKDLKGKGRVQMSGGAKGVKVQAMTKGEKERSRMRGALKFLPHAAAAGMGGKMMYDKYKK